MRDMKTEFRGFQAGITCFEINRQKTSATVSRKRRRKIRRQFYRRLPRAAAAREIISFDIVPDAGTGLMMEETRFRTKTNPEIQTRRELYVGGLALGRSGTLAAGMLIRSE